MKKSVIAVTVHKIPHKGFCGVVILKQEPNRSWNGQCSRCEELFRIEEDPTFEARVFAMRN